MAPQKLIIDTDPGVDDVMAMLLALSARPEELEVALLSVTYGNVPVDCCLRNVVGMFEVLEKELEWRKANGKPEGFETMLKNKPIVAPGPEHGLEAESLKADYFHGADGLHDVHEALPHYSPADTWKALFDGSSPEAASATKFFKPSSQPGHKEMLRILRENPPDTVTICAVGPLTTCALAAAEDPETFLRVKELVVMGGAVHVEGNVTPVAEFNTFADVTAAARVYALTSLQPSSTMPKSTLGPYPDRLSRQLKLTLAPLDITTPHEIGRSFFNERIKQHIDAGSPLAIWVAHFLGATFDNIERMCGPGQEPALSLHDPLTIWFAQTREDPRWKFPAKLEDIRVETTGSWSSGMHVVDKRQRTKPAELVASASTLDPRDNPEVVKLDDVPGDEMGWRSVIKGNRLNRIIESPGVDVFADIWMKSVFA